MKILKWSLIIIGAIILLLLIVALFLPSSDRVERCVNINGSPEKIAEHITDLKKWNDWSPWKDADTAALYTYNDTIGAGGSMSWNGKILGSGKLTITSNNTSKIDYDLTFFEPFQSFSQGNFSLMQDKNDIKITWVNQGELSYPIGRIMGLFMSYDKMMGPDFEKGLKKLKEVVEKDPGIATFEIKESTVESQTIAAIRNKVVFADIPKTMQEIFSTIPAYIAKNGGTITGPPMAITINYTNDSWDFEGAFPVNKEIKGTEKIQIKKSYSGKVIYLVYFGPYDQTATAYNELHKYLKTKNLEENGGPWEVYLTDPSSEPDPSKWKTEIYFPIK